MSNKHQKILKDLKGLGIQVKSTQPLTRLEDGMIELGGDYSDYHIQLGRGYYVVGREMKDGSFLFKDGDGQLGQELRSLSIA